MDAPSAAESHALRAADDTRSSRRKEFLSKHDQVSASAEAWRNWDNITLADVKRLMACKPIESTHAVRFAIGELCKSDGFRTLINALIVINVAIMAMPYYGMSTGFAAALELGQDACTVCFVVEMGLKLLGMGCKDYWGDGWNLLDGTLVLVSLVELVLKTFHAHVDYSGPQPTYMRAPLRFLRMLRVLRILRLMRSWRSLHKIVVTFGKSMTLSRYHRTGYCLTGERRWSSTVDASSTRGGLARPGSRGRTGMRTGRGSSEPWKAGALQPSCGVNIESFYFEVE